MYVQDIKINEAKLCEITDEEVGSRKGIIYLGIQDKKKQEKKTVRLLLSFFRQFSDSVYFF